MSLFRLLFGFSGRMNRSKYWLVVVLWIVLWVVAVSASLLAALVILGANVPDSSLPTAEQATQYIRMVWDYALMFIIIIAFIVASWISAFAIGIKRLHDRNKSGWWILLFYLAPTVIASIANAADQPLASLVLGLASIVISIWALVELGFLRGTVGPNQYGPDPLQSHAGTDVSIASASAGP